MTRGVCVCCGRPLWQFSRSRGLANAYARRCVACTSHATPCRAVELIDATIGATT